MHYFFTAFAMFDTSHKVVLAVLVVLAAALVIITRRAGSEVTNRRIAIALTAALLFNKLIVYCTVFMIEGNGWEQSLPMHMCDVSAIAAIVTLLWRKQLSYEMAYFWALGGTLQATLTPDLKYDFPDVRFLTFFISHGGTLVAVAFLTLGLKMRPYPVSLLRIFIWSNIYLVVAGTVDWLTGENYGYLRRKPFNPSLLDHLGPWPWYILSLEGMALLSYLVYYAPFYFMDLRRKKKSPPAFTSA